MQNKRRKLIEFVIARTSIVSQMRRDSKDAPIKPSVYKKRPAPVPADRDDIVRPAVVNAGLGSAIGKLNPVKEMQILGRNNSEVSTICAIAPSNLNLRHN